MASPDSVPVSAQFYLRADNAVAWGLVSYETARARLQAALNASPYLYDVSVQVQSYGGGNAVLLEVRAKSRVEWQRAYDLRQHVGYICEQAGWHWNSSDEAWAVAPPASTAVNQQGARVLAPTVTGGGRGAALESFGIPQASGGIFGGLDNLLNSPIVYGIVALLILKTVLDG